MMEKDEGARWVLEEACGSFDGCHRACLEMLEVARLVDRRDLFEDDHMGVAWRRLCVLLSRYIIHTCLEDSTCLVLRSSREVNFDLHTRPRRLRLHLQHPESFSGIFPLDYLHRAVRIPRWGHKTLCRRTRGPENRAASFRTALCASSASSEGQLGLKTDAACIGLKSTGDDVV